MSKQTNVCVMSCCRAVHACQSSEGLCNHGLAPLMLCSMIMDRIYELSAPQSGKLCDRDCEYPLQAGNHCDSDTLLNKEMAWSKVRISIASVVRGFLGTDPPDPTLESASPSPPQGSSWHRFDINFLVWPYFRKGLSPEFRATRLWRGIRKGLSGDILLIFLCLRPKRAPEKSARNPGYQWYARKSGKSPAQYFDAKSTPEQGRARLNIE